MDFETRIKKDLVDKYIKYSTKFNGNPGSKYMTPIYIIHKNHGILKISAIKEAGPKFSNSYYVHIDDSHGFYKFEKETLYLRVKTRDELERYHPELFV